MTTYTETEYLRLYKHRREEGGRSRWLEASRNVLSGFLNLSADPVDTDGPGFANAVKILSGSWSVEARCALSAAAYCFWSLPIADILPGMRSTVYRPLLDQALKDKIEGGNIQEIEKTFALAVLAHQAAPKPEAYREFECALLQGVQDRLGNDACILMARAAWPVVLDRDGEFLPGSLVWDESRGFFDIAPAVGRQLERLNLAKLAQGIVEAMIEEAKEIYGDVFSNLPKTTCCVFDGNAPEHRGRSSGSYDYVSPDQKAGDRVTGFGFDYRDPQLGASLPNFIGKIAHETEHILQSHLAWLIARGKIPTGHPLYEAAQAFNAYHEEAAKLDGAKTWYPFRHKATVRNLWQAYMSAPREWMAWQLGDALQKTCSEKWRMPGFGGLSANYLLDPSRHDNGFGLLKGAARPLMSSKRVSSSSFDL